MANIAPLVNTRGPLHVHPAGIVRRTHFHAFAMYANLLGDRVVEADINAEPLTDGGGNSIPVIDAIATVDDAESAWSIALQEIGFSHSTCFPACKALMLHSA